MHRTNIHRPKLKFTSTQNREFIVELRKQVAQYFEENNISKYGNTNLRLKTVFMFTLYLTPYVLMMSGIVSSFAAVFACWVIIGVGKAGVGMGIMHDANHRTYSKHQAVNKWMGKSLYLLGGFPANWQHQHNTMHHGFTNIEGHDEDIDTGDYLRLSPHKPRKKIHAFQHIYAWFLYGLMTILWVTTKDFNQLRGYKKEGVKLNSRYSYDKLMFIMVLSKVLYYIAFMVIPIIVLPFAWYWIVLFFLTMHFTAGFILTVIFQTAHVMPTSEYPLPDTRNNMENDWAVHQLKTTANFATDNRIITWLTGGLNHQVEHHLFPNISHVHYSRVAPIVKRTAQAYGIPYHSQPGFIRAVYEHGKMLKMLGRSL